MFFEDHIDDTKYLGHLYGLGTSYVQNGSSYDNHHGYGPPPAAGNNGGATGGGNNTEDSRSTPSNAGTPTTG